MARCIAPCNHRTAQAGLVQQALQNTAQGGAHAGIARFNVDPMRRAGVAHVVNARIIGATGGMDQRVTPRVQRIKGGLHGLVFAALVAGRGAGGIKRDCIEPVVFGPGDLCCGGGGNRS